MPNPHPIPSSRDLRIWPLTFIGFIQLHTLRRKPLVDDVDHFTGHIEVHDGKRFGEAHDDGGPGKMGFRGILAGKLYEKH